MPHRTESTQSHSTQTHKHIVLTQCRKYLEPNRQKIEDTPCSDMEQNRKTGRTELMGSDHGRSRLWKDHNRWSSRHQSSEANIRTSSRWNTRLHRAQHRRGGTRHEIYKHESRTSHCDNGTVTEKQKSHLQPWPEQVEVPRQ